MTDPTSSHHAPKVRGGRFWLKIGRFMLASCVCLCIAGLTILLGIQYPAEVLASATAVLAVTGVMSVVIQRNRRQ